MKKQHRITIILISVLLLLGISGLYILQGFNISNDNYGVAHKKLFNAFYAQDKDSLDAVYFGASSVTRYWIPALAFEENGIAVSGLGTTGQPFVMMKYLMKEAKKTQSDALFIVEFRSIFKSTSWVHEINVRRVTDNMKPSLNRLQAVNAGLDYMSSGGNSIGGSPLGVYFPALETAKRTLKGNVDERVPFFDDQDISWNNGFIFSYSTFQTKKVRASKYNTIDKEVLPPENEKALYDLLDYCDTIDNDILFVLSPWSGKKSNYPYVNTAIDIIESRGYDVLNMNTPDKLQEIGIDWDTDFYNRLHTNLSGAEKYTLYLADYIQQRYELEDHRGDQAYSEWAESTELYKARKAIKK